MNALEELKENLLQKRKQKQHVIAVDYVLKKLREAEGVNRPLRPPQSDGDI
jgi:hypothetical protein